jgi:transposase
MVDSGRVRPAGLSSLRATSGWGPGSVLVELSVVEQRYRAVLAVLAEHPKRRRWHLHFTPTSSSWLNLVETWFSVLTRKALTNASFGSVAELEAHIDHWVARWNDNPEPFTWTKTADEIIDKVTRGRATLDRITKTRYTTRCHPD